MKETERKTFNSSKLRKLLKKKKADANYLMGMFAYRGNSKSHQTFFNWISGAHAPQSVNDVLLLSEILGVNMDYFFD